MKSSKKNNKKPSVKAKKGVDVFKDWLKNQNVKDVSNLALNVGLAIAGEIAFKPNEPKGMFLSAMWGPIGLKLATTPGSGITSPSQIAGLGMLGFLGLGVLPQDVKDQLSETINDTIKPTPFGLFGIKEEIEERRIFGIKNPFTDETIWELKV